MTDNNRGSRLLSRRETLGLVGAAAGAVALAATVGCGDDDDPTAEQSTTAGTATVTAESATEAATTAAATQTPAMTTAAPAEVSCVITPEVTEGPYFVDERLLRADIRSDPATGEVSEGVPLSITMTVSSVSGGACTPLAGAVVDMWHCDALGTYSDVSGGAGQVDTSGRKYLRGYQVTDANGQVRFQTIYPGWYSGRTIHIHYKVRTDPDSASGLEFTSQLFFAEAVTDVVMAVAPYSHKGSPDTRNTTDNIYQAELLMSLNGDTSGYTGSFHVGVNTG